MSNPTDSSTPSDPAHASFTARRVTTGLNSDGRSIIESDEISTTKTVTPGWTVTDVWQMDSLPPALADGHTLEDDGRTKPAPVGGVVWRMAMFPPDTSWSPPPPEIPGEPPAMHVNESVDVLTVVSGEIYAVMQEGETLLRVGDTIVQRGTRHAWSNRTYAPCVIIGAMVRAPGGSR